MGFVWKNRLAVVGAIHYIEDVSHGSESEIFDPKSEDCWSSSSSGATSPRFEPVPCTCGAYSPELKKKKKKGLFAKAKRLTGKLLLNKKAVTVSSPEDCPRCSHRFAWIEA